jgi:hypothetical protein
MPGFAEADTGWGWGLSYVWAKAVDYRGIYIFDAAPMWHTRPVGKARSEQDHEDARHEWARILSEHNLSPIKRTLFACDESGKRIEMSKGSFELAYLNGYDYLIARNPRLLLHITRDQLAKDPPVPQPKRGGKADRLRRWWRRLKSGVT